ncbi:MAG: His/Gly/Thr/Pro-type tRNA ligase C-terminal domain-containing protein [Ignavibacteriales bacterium]|nr:His/Gly/Thr/Pro-type tRNA ligase C-terminal domain-containing protein [Ignavibacteriales bacterium]
MESVVKKSEELYDALCAKGLMVLFDDRTTVSPGFKFKDADLLGMPLHVIVGDKNLKNGQIELKERATGKRWTAPAESVVDEVVAWVK